MTSIKKKGHQFQRSLSHIFSHQNRIIWACKSNAKSYNYLSTWPSVGPRFL